MLPAYFISHGSPDIILRQTPAAQFLAGLKLPQARAILVISAHWMTHEPMVTAHPAPKTIHDFGGFQEELYQMRYPVAGDALLAAEAISHLTPAFPLSALDPKRGLDHGAWLPLLMSNPQADIPVLQLSIQPHRDARHHYEVGKRLRDLREQGVIIMASGNATHNLRAALHHMRSAPGHHHDTPQQAINFNDWLYNNLKIRDDQELMRWEKAPDAIWNHPSTDHLFPLYTALGAGMGSNNAHRLHHSFDLGVLSMDAYRL